MPDQLPVIDLAPLSTGRGISEVAQVFRNAYTEYGFGIVVNHGIAADHLCRLFEASTAFHALPRAEKNKLELNRCHRGFIANNTSIDVNSPFATIEKPNQSESFLVMREDLPDSTPVVEGAYLAGPNQWPELSGFRATVESAQKSFTCLGRSLMQVACKALGVEQSRMMPAFETPTTWLRLLHYPPQPPQSPADLYGSAPHTDFGCITILAQDDVAGLQVMSPEGSWIDVPPQSGSLVVNIGDMLHRWSNGVLRSTPHRVINRSGVDRYSCAFFYDPYVETVVAPLHECVSVERPLKFEAVHFGDFLRAELEAAYQQHK
ncbi:2OG-Fe(II) oxygenase [Chromatiales bacterium (ex Bugula neritina AB1)]|nr:2OG-Fe(II) oxygenase [Chromatiales bacterium (ex Bugula neritina AB1)]